MTLLECKLSESWVLAQPHMWTPPHIQELHLSSAVSLQFISELYGVHDHCQPCFWPCLLCRPTFLWACISRRNLIPKKLCLLSQEHIWEQQERQKSAQTQKAWKYFKRSLCLPFWIEIYIWTPLLFDSCKLA